MGKAKNLWIVLALFGILALAGCGGSGGGSNTSSGGAGSAPATIAGTWNMANNTGGQWPQQAVFSSGGTGTSTMGSFTWTQSGNQVTMTFQNGSKTTISNLPANVGNTITLMDSAGRTASYARA